MSHILAIPCIQAQAYPAFAKLNLEYKNAIRVGDLGLRGISPTTSMNQLLWKWNYPSIIASGVTGQPQPITGKLLSFKTSMFTPIRDTENMVSFGTDDIIPAELIDEAGVEKTNPRSRMAFGYKTKGMISILKIDEFAKFFERYNISTTISVQGCGFSINGMRSLRLLSGLINEYCRTQNHFMSNDELPIDINASGHEVVKVVRTIAEKSYIDYKEGDTSDEPERVVNLSNEDWTSLNWDPELEYHFINSGVKDLHNNFYKMDDAPSAGHLFRFVPGGSPADEEFFTDKLYTHFMRLFGTSLRQIHQRIKLVTSVVPLLNKNRHGQEILFLFPLVILSIECKGELMPIYSSSDDLMGAVIEARSAITVRDEYVEPLSELSIVGEMAKWTTSDEARKDVADVLSKSSLKNGGGKEILAASDLASCLDLLNEISKRERIGNPTGKFINSVSMMGYTFNPETANLENITSALNNIASRKLAADFLVTITLFVEDDLVVSTNLSRFGHQSISFMNTGGKRIDIYKRAADDPLNGKKRKIVVSSGKKRGKKNRLEQESVEEEIDWWAKILVTRTTIATAVLDFKILVDQHYIRQVQTYDVKILGNVLIHNLDKGDGFMSALRQFGKDKKVEVADDPSDGGVKLGKKRNASESSIDDFDF